MKRFFILAVLLVLVFAGCATTGKPLRYDGVYKIPGERGGVSYIKFIDEKSFKILNGFKGSDEKALEELQQNDNGKIFYSNYPEKIYYSQRSGSLVGSAQIKRNADGSLVNSFFLVTKDGKIAEKIDHRNMMKVNLYSLTGDKVLKQDYDEILPFSSDKFIVNYLGNFGLKDISGNTVISEKCNFIGPLNDGMAKISIDYRWGYLDSDGKIAIKPEFDDEGEFIDGIAAVKKGDLWYLISKDGKKVYENGFFRVGDYFSKKLIPVRVDSGSPWNFFSAEKGELLKITGPRYRMEKKLNLMLLSDSKKTFVLDLDGNPYLPYYFTYIWPVDRDRFIIRIKGRQGVIDSKMKPILPFVFDKVSGVGLSNGKEIYFETKNGDLRGVFDYNGKTFIAPDFGQIAQKGEKVFIRYYFDSHNEKIYVKGRETPFFEAEGFNKLFPDYYSFEKEKKWGVVDISGKVIIEAEYDKIEAGLENQFIVKDGKKYGVLDLKGKKIFDFEYGSISKRNGLYFLFKDEKSYIFINNKLKSIEGVSVFSAETNDLFTAIKNNNGFKWGAVNSKGEEVVPFDYDQIKFDKTLNSFIVKKK